MINKDSNFYDYLVSIVDNHNNTIQETIPTSKNFLSVHHLYANKKHHEQSIGRGDRGMPGNGRRYPSNVIRYTIPVSTRTPESLIRRNLQNIIPDTLYNLFTPTRQELDNLFLPGQDDLYMTNTSGTTMGIPTVSDDITSLLSSIINDSPTKKSKKPNKYTKTVDGEFFITTNLNNFIDTLSSSIKIQNLIIKLFKGELDIEEYNKLYKEFLFKFKHIEETDDGYIIINNGKQKIKMGKFLSKIIQILDKSFTNDDISHNVEQIVDQYKSWYKTANEFKFVVLRGTEILKGYSYEYQYNKGGGSPLVNSCMNGKQYLLKLYTQNEDKLLLLTLQKGTEIYGRCLIWRLDDPEIIYMDRVYGSENYINNIFEKLARNNRWNHRENSAYDKFEIFEYDQKYRGHYSKYSHKLNYKVKLDVSGIKNFPYMDSFCVMNRFNNTFYLNEDNKISINRLKSTHGGYQRKINFLGIELNKSFDV